ncbi:MAG: hypothetical protein AB7G34_12105 [Hyphomicrobiales bacterium]
MGENLNPWPVIPNDAIEYFRRAFAEANRVAAERIVTVPNIRETTLDDAVVDALIPFSPPKRLQSGTVVEMDIHNIGGLRRLYHWETADIAVLVFVYRGRQMIAQKIGLLQTKRLFPKNNEVLDDDREGFRYGMNTFLNRDSRSPLAVLNRDFVFDQTCIYGSLKAASEQVTSINHLNEKFGESVYYMFYNPPTVPVRIKYPLRSKRLVKSVKLGCRVFTTNEIHRVLKTLQNGRSPSLDMIRRGGKSSNWRLDSWVADLLLRCKSGQRFDDDMKELVFTLLERRSGPIGAAIAVSVALPND